ncbi:SDR family NAD(P)-dependent oxidoreductase [Mycolicibacterium confluentis]|nr:SDR family NAD(P)-dependent oxidoreductase [Mycolicibacterium confluentis]MCV7321856.1 SDR family NAD(P)-dependent oxidoreductase [Mycolicibacterium confluentis]
MTLSTENRLVVITGASTGIGAATARELAQRGFHVLAGVRRERDADVIRRPNIEPLILDITNPEHIRALAERVREDPQGRALRAVVNNAAVQANVPVEAFAIDQWRDMFEVNLFGHVAVIQALLQSLIDSRGRVVNISSVGGKIAMATYGPYAGTKFALEAVSDSLRREVAPHGVQVVVIEPGAVRTEMLGRAIASAHDPLAAMTSEQRRRYGGLVQAVNAQAEASTRSGLPAEAAAAVIAKAITARKPRTRYTVGREAALLSVTRLLPDRLLDRIFAAALRPYMPKEEHNRPGSPHGPFGRSIRPPARGGLTNRSDPTTREASPGWTL